METTLLTIAQAATQLALAPATIRKWIALHHIPVVRLGRAVRLRRADVEAIARGGIQHTIYRRPNA